MRRSFVVVVICFAVGFPPGTSPLRGQSAAPRNPIQLQLDMEVATTTDDGAPETLRFTLTNVGNSTINLPRPSVDCSGENGVIVLHSIVRDTSSGSGHGHGCSIGATDEPTLMERVEKSWLHLRPGESLTFLGDCRQMLDRVDGPATYEYWAAYEPPKLSTVERRQLAGAGYNVPSEKIETSHLTFSGQ